MGHYPDDTLRNYSDTLADKQDSQGMGAHSNKKNDHNSGHDKTYSIIVNGRQREVTDHKLTYLEVVQLAYPGEEPSDKIVFTVTYSNPHGKDGSLVAGDEIKIKDGVIINVVRTDQS